MKNGEEFIGKLVLREIEEKNFSSTILNCLLSPLSPTFIISNGRKHQRKVNVISFQLVIVIVNRYHCLTLTLDFEMSKRLLTPLVILKFGPVFLGS